MQSMTRLPPARPRGTRVAQLHGHPPGWTSRWRPNMHQRRIPIDAQQRPALAPHVVTTADDVEHTANVAVLSDYVADHLADEPDHAFAEARNGAFKVLSIGHDLRASPAGPEG